MGEMNAAESDPARQVARDHFLAPPDDLKDRLGDDAPVE